jgi:hypothetical protein
MVLAYAVVCLIGLALLLRRDLKGVAGQSYRGGWKLAAAVAGLFIVQAALVVSVPGSGRAQAALLILSQGALMLLLAVNRHLPGARLFAAGVLLNTAVMVANGGWMPVTPEMYHFVRGRPAAEAQARPPSSKGIVLPREETRLWFLSDIIRLSLPGRRTAASVGDVLLIAGAAQFIFVSTAKRADPLARDNLLEVEVTP